jgi:hypothetical protein
MGRYCCSIVPRVSLEAWMASAVDGGPTVLALGPICKGYMLFRTPFTSVPWGMGYNRPWATLRTKKRATRKTPGCRDRSRQFNKGYIGNAQYGRVEVHFWILKGLGSAHLVKCLRSSSDPLYTGSNPNPLFEKKKKTHFWREKNLVTIIWRAFPAIACSSLTDCW